MKEEGGRTTWLVIERARCTNDGCGRLHNVLPDCLAKFKHYETRVIQKVLDDDLSPGGPAEKDYPCDETMRRWRHWFMANYLRIEGYLKAARYSYLDGDAVKLMSPGSLLTHERATNKRWLAAIIRTIYNSGGYLVPS